MDNHGAGAFLDLRWLVAEEAEMRNFSSLAIAFDRVVDGLTVFSSEEMC
jgi:hypothetical protein